MSASSHSDTTVKMRMSVISVTLAMKRKPGQLFRSRGQFGQFSRKRRAEWGQYVRTNSRRGERHFSRDEVEADLACFDV